MNMEHKAVVKIAITIWTCSDEIIELLDNYPNTNEWIRVNSFLREHCNKLPLPNVLKEKINHFLPHIGFEIIKFTDYLSVKISLDNKSLKYVTSKLVWKTQGVIDRKKSVKNLIDEQTLNLSIRYKLACIFCFEEDILQLWNKLPDNEKSPFLSSVNQTDCFLNNVTIWSLYNGKQENILSTKSIEMELDSLTLFEFLCSVHECVPEAVEFYLQKFPSGERKWMIFRAMNLLQNLYYDVEETYASSNMKPRYYKGILDEIVVFLFNETENESLEMLVDEIDNYNLCVLECFLQWPFWELFLSSFEKLQPHLHGVDYLRIITLLQEKILEHCVSGDCSYLLILKDVWKISSKSNKESIYRFLPCLLSTVLKFNDDNLVSLILNDIPPPVKSCLLFTDEGIVTCITLGSNKMWNILEIIVSRFIVEEKLKDFQSLFSYRFKMEKLFHSHVDLQEIDYETASHVYNFLEDVINKRVMNEFEGPPTKKICRFK